ALSWGLSCSMRASDISTSSREETSPERTIAASSVAGRNIRSLSVTALLLLGGDIPPPVNARSGTPTAHRSRAGPTTRHSGAYLGDSCDDMSLPTRQPGQ